MPKKHKLLDHVLKVLKLKTDVQLCRELEVMPCILSNIRNGRLQVGATLILRIHELTGMEVKLIKEMAGV